MITIFEKCVSYTRNYTWYSYFFSIFDFNIIKIDAFALLFFRPTKIRLNIEIILIFLFFCTRLHYMNYVVVIISVFRKQSLLLFWNWNAKTATYQQRNCHRLMVKSSVFCCPHASVVVVAPELASMPHSLMTNDFSLAHRTILRDFDLSTLHC